MKTSREVANGYAEIGYNKCSEKIGKTLVLSILAGMFIAFGGIGSAVASCTVDNPSVARIISGCVFPAGLAMVVLVGAELFTGDCLIAISVLEKKTSIVKFARTLVVVYIGNFIGSMIVGLCAVYGHTLAAFDGRLAQMLVSTATTKANIGFVDGLLKGIMCNVLVCVAVWMSMTAERTSGKIVALFLPIMVFVICGYEHSVANMFYIPTGIMAAKEYGIDTQGLNWYGFFVTNEIPVTIGNIVGGMMVALSLWYTQMAGKRK